MFSTVPYTHEGLSDLGAALGLDPERLAQDAGGEEVNAILDANRRLAASIGVDGTPSFVIGDLLVVGAMDKAAFLGLIAALDNP
jgi:2-hydroxychromene-2-carboxylate isomerase